MLIQAFTNFKVGNHKPQYRFTMRRLAHAKCVPLWLVQQTHGHKCTNFGVYVAFTFNLFCFMIPGRCFFIYKSICLLIGLVGNWIFKIYVTTGHKIIIMTKTLFRYPLL